MRILFLTNRLPFPLNDGGNIASYYTIKFLKEKGHHVTLFSLNTNKHYSNPENLRDITDEIHTFDINTDLRKIDGLKALFSELPYNALRFYDENCDAKLQTVLKNNNFDIIQFEGPYMFLYENSIRKYSSAKLIYRSHNVEYKIWERQAQNERFFPKRMYLYNLSRKIKRFELKCLNNTDAYIPISEDDAVQLKRFVPEKKAATIQTGIDFKDYKFEAPQHENTLCFIGSLQWMPNLQGLDWFLDEVFYKLNQNKNDYDFHVAGKNPPEYLNQKQMKGFHFHGMVPSQVDFLNTYDILIVPLLSGSGMRIKIVEALALKKCIISTTVGCEGIALRHKHSVWIADTPDEIIEAIKTLTSNKELKESIAENGYQFAKEKYDWNNLIEEFENFYSEL